jgi:deoxyribodipyrimidine photo-lyase
MRQLAQTGWMPNRARMVAASFLCKHLLLDWRSGERFFMQSLLDGDTAANNGGWQWTAGTGTDAQPFFRIFNPVLQSRKFDPQGEYLRRWIPELLPLPAALVHTPWQAPKPPIGYPLPIIEHRFARQRTLAALRHLRQSKARLPTLPSATHDL